MGRAISFNQTNHLLNSLKLVSDRFSRLNLVEHFSAENYQQHCHYMAIALQLAEASSQIGEIPVGAVIINSEGTILSRSTNRKENEHDATAHAEIVAIRAASHQLQSWHLENCRLYVTLEPCPMCAGAIIQARLGLLVYGAADPKSGAIRTVLNLPDSPASNHRLTVIGGILESACREQLQSWFQQKRSVVD